nr:glycosyltransferase [Cytophagales bacterium]
MKIIYIAGWPIPSRAANAVHVMKMCQAFVHNGHNVSLICPQAMPDDLDGLENVYDHYGVEEKFEIHSFKKPQSRVGLIFYALRVALYARSKEHEYIHSRCLICSWMCSLIGLPIIFECHNSFINQSRWVNFIFNSLLKKSSFIGLVVISKALEHHLVKHHNISEDQIIVAHDGADPFDVANAKPKFDKSPGKLHAGYIGHLYKGRGIDLIGKMAKQLPNVEFHIVGGTQDDLKYWSEVFKNIENLHLYGYVPHKDTAGFIQNFDILLATYQKNATGYKGASHPVKWMSPLKIFEYMATGIPMICSDLPVLHEILRDRKNAFLCIDDDANDWIETIKYIEKNYEEAQKIAQNAKEEFLTTYTWKKRAEHICVGIKTLLSSNA